jgi:hypothetical protein
MISHISVELNTYIPEIPVIRVNDHAWLIYTSLSDMWYLMFAYYTTGGQSQIMHSPTRLWCPFCQYFVFIQACHKTFITGTQLSDMVIGQKWMSEHTIWLSPSATSYTNGMRHRCDRVAHISAIRSHSSHHIEMQISEMLVFDSTLTQLPKKISAHLFTMKA